MSATPNPADRPYLRYPHLSGDQVAFVAANDVWVAPLDGGRAYRITSVGLPVKNPRFTSDGSELVFSVIQGKNPELATVPVAGGPLRRLTWFGHASTRMRGFTPEGKALVASSFEQPDPRLVQLYTVDLGTKAAEKLHYGPADSLAYGPRVGDEKPLVLATAYSREPAWWKRYRGGTSGKLWIDRDGSDEFERLVPELDGNLVDPMWVDGRIAFLSDHEGYGNLYSVTPDGDDLRRHTDHEGFYVRHASTDGKRIIFESAGNLFVVDSLDADAQPRQLDIRLGGGNPATGPQLLDLAANLGEVIPAHDAGASLVHSYGTVHLLTHQEGPARVLVAEAGVRARLARPVGDSHIAYIADRDGVEALYIDPIDPLLLAPAEQGEDAGQGKGVQPRQEHPDDAGTGNLPTPVTASSVNQSPAAAAAVANSPQLGTSDREAGEEQATAAVNSNKQQQGVEKQDSRKALDLGSERIRIDLPQPVRVAELKVTGNGALIAVGTEQGRLYLVDPQRASVTEAASTNDGGIEDFTLSSDGTWLAYVEPVASGNDRSKLVLLPTAGGKGIEVTDGRFVDFSPAFTPDGKYLAFLSQRSLDPVYNLANFDLAFPVTTKPYLVALQAGTASPFGPYLGGKPAAPKAEQPPSSSADTSASTTVDVEGLAQRIIPVPVAQSNYSHLLAGDGALYWLDHDLEGTLGDSRASVDDEAAGDHLVRFDLVSRETVTLADKVEAFDLSADRSSIVAVADGGILVVPSDKKVDADSPDRVQVNLTRVRLWLSPAKIWGQAFDEAWRLQRDFYWDPQMAGNDWDAVYAAYRPLVARLGSHDDLVDLLWEMHGELGTSHAYVQPKPVTAPGAADQGFLGAEFTREGNTQVVVRVLPGESSDPRARSPLQAPGVDVRAGDAILAVNGIAPGSAGIAGLLDGAGGQVVELSVRNGKSHDGEVGTVRRVAVVPLKDEAQLRYQDWVRTNREYVQEASQGTFGYLHVPDMMARGWAELHRDLDREFAKDAVVVDVRRNRGGHTSQLVAEVLGRKITAWSLPRGAQPGTYPYTAPRGPIVLLTDEFAGSDGDIITQVTKLRGIGPVIGTRTWGGVVGIDGKFALVDGTGVTQPRYATWFTGGVGWGVENYGVDPDIEVLYPPHAHLAGEDPQLASAIGILREMNAEIPTVQAPELKGFASKQPGKLPPRPAGRDQRGSAGKDSGMKG